MRKPLISQVFFRAYYQTFLFLCDCRVTEALMKQPTFIDGIFLMHFMPHHLCIAGQMDPSKRKCLKLRALLFYG